MNLTNNAQLTTMAKELDDILVPADRLRKDKALRTHVAQQAGDILKRLPC